MVRKKNPQMNDVELIPCPHCGKGIVWQRPVHRCKMTIPHLNYISKVVRAQLLWTPEKEWGLYWYPEEIHIDELRFVDVANWINDESAQFKPVLPKENEE